MRPIDADELNKFPIRIDHYDKENGNIDFVLGIESVMEYVEYMPTIEAEPVRHGRWIPKENIIRRPYARNHYCSECRCDPIETGIFCNNCGARMDGGADDGGEYI